MFIFFAGSLQERLQVGFSTLRELILKRPATQQQLLQTLLELTTNEKEQVRVQAIHSAKKLHTRPELAESIEVNVVSGLTPLLFIGTLFSSEFYSQNFSVASCDLSNNANTMKRV